MITRVKHGEPDEIIVKSIQPAGTCFDNTSYFENSSARSDLAGVSPANTSVSSFNNLIQTQRPVIMNCATAPGTSSDYFDSEPDEFVFNFLKYSGKFIYDNASNDFIVTTTSNDIFKIEFEFGTDLQYNTNIKVNRYIKKFTVKTYEGFKYEFGGSYTDNNIEFFLGAPSDHYLYNSTANPLDKGNLLYSSTWYLTKITSPTGAIANFTYEDGGIAGLIIPAVDIGKTGGVTKNTNFNSYSIPINTVAYLKDITAGSKKITFDRKRTCSRYTATNTHDVEAQEEETPDYPKLLRTDPNTNTSNILAAYNNVYSTGLLENTHAGYLTIKNDWQKLTDVNIYEGALNTDVFHLDYYTSRIYNTADETFKWGESSTGRLELKSITRKGYQSQNYIPYYGFKYYGQQTIVGGTASQNRYARYAYGTRKVDHWGFYNGTDYFAPYLLDTTGIVPDAQYAAGYRESRDPGVQYTDGLLKRILYPTGGYSEIEYEQHNYARRMEYTVSSGALSLVNEGQDVKGGGFRVKKITGSSEITGSATVAKNYYYNTIGGTLSSGILNSGRPDYFTGSYTHCYIYGSNQTGNIINNTTSATTYVSMSSIGQLPGYFEGNYITYSSVTEKWSDNSFKTYEYSNSDNSDYRDAIVRYNLTGNPTYFKNGEPFHWFLSRSTERGKLLKERFFKAGNTSPEKEITYEYNNASSRYDNKVNYMKKDGRPLPGLGYFSVQSYLSSYYSYYSFLKRKTETDFYNSQPVTTVADYSYNGIRTVISQSVTLPSGEIVTNSYSYADQYNPGSGGNDLVRSVYNLKTKDLLRYPIEQAKTISKNNQQTTIEAKILTYKADAPVLKSESVLETATPLNNFTPLNISGNSSSQDNHYHIDAVNVTQFSPEIPYPQSVIQNNKKSAIIRDFKQTRITAIAQNAAYGDIAYTSFEGSYTTAAGDVNKGNWAFNLSNVSTAAGGVTGKRSYAFGTSSGFFTNATTMDYGRRYVLSYWEKGGTVSPNIPSSTIIGTIQSGISVDGWQLKVIKFTASNARVNIYGTGYVDEIRLVPEETLMETHCYDDQGQLCEQADKNNIITRYAYDELHRLILIKDANGKILKKTEYGLQSPDNN